jgi:GT2 family glycosyltransferase
VRVPKVSVVIPCYTEDRWAQLVDAVQSALTQDPAPAELVVVVDHNDQLLARARREIPGVLVVPNEFQRGVSGNRNTGVAHTTSPIVAMLDDDARARPGWLANLVAPFADPSVVGTGGAILPVWEGRRPAWFPDEFLWAVVASYTGMPTVAAPVRNVWSASMAVRRDVFDAVGGFRVDFGKVADRSRPEDTDLCLRMSDLAGGGWMYVPEALIDHPVSAQRSTVRYFLQRCFNEGRGKIEMARLNKGRGSLGSERDYVTRTLPRAVGRGLIDTVRGRDAAGVAKSGAVLAGLSAAAVGGLVEALRPVRSSGARKRSTAPAVAAGIASGGQVGADR